MFDAKSLLDALMRGANPTPASPAAAAGSSPGAGGIGDILGRMMQGGGQGGGGLGDMLGRMLQGAGSAQGGLNDLVGKLQQMASDAQAGKAGNIIDVLGRAFNQAKEGVKEGAGKADQATGASEAIRDLLQKHTGKSPEELLAQLQELIRNNQLGAGAALGGLGAIVLGTRSGRSLATGAVKLGALALIGGLAYKAYQNYSHGKPILAGGEAPPTGSGFEPQAISNDTATLYVRAMIAAAAADGRIDDGEQKRIAGGLDHSGAEPAAIDFLRQEMGTPATVEQLAAAVKSQEEAIQVYTAARVAVDVESVAESEFLRALAAALKLDPALVQSIDEAARSAS